MGTVASSTTLKSGAMSRKALKTSAFALPITDIKLEILLSWLGSTRVLLLSCLDFGLSGTIEGLFIPLLSDLQLFIHFGTF